MSNIYFYFMSQEQWPFYAMGKLKTHAQQTPISTPIPRVVLSSPQISLASPGQTAHDHDR